MPISYFIQMLCRLIIWSHQSSWLSIIFTDWLSIPAHCRWWTSLRVKSAWLWLKPIMAARWLVMHFRPCASICHISILVWQQFSAMIAPFVRKVRPLLKLVMKCSLLPLHSISARWWVNYSDWKNRISGSCWLVAVISVQGWRVVWKKITALNSSNVISSALPNWRKNCRIRSSFLVMRRIKNYWPKNISIKLICLLPSPTMTRPISCPPCLPNVWVRKRWWYWSSVALM